MKSFVLMLTVILGLSPLFIGCAKQQTNSHYHRTTTSEPEFFYHTVKYRGETLGLIARWYTGNTANWQLILKENPGMRPERINLGDVIRIPSRLVTEKSPLPERVVPGSRANATTSTITQTKAPVQTKKLDSKSDRSEPVFDEFDDFKAAQGNEIVAERTDAVAPSFEKEQAVEPSQPARRSPEEIERERLLEELLGE